MNKHQLAYGEGNPWWFKAREGYTYMLYEGKTGWRLEIMHQIQVRNFFSYSCFLNNMGDYGGMGLFNKNGELIMILIGWFEVQAHIAELLPFADIGWGGSWEDIHSRP